MRIGTRAQITRLTTTLATALLATALAACGEHSSSSSSANSTPAVAGKLTAGAPADTDVAARGGSIPNGYSVAFDHAGTKAADVSYAAREPGKWEVTTGPAHILWSAADTARKKYVASATFEQLSAPSHPEAFGIFVGGSGLDGASARYTYFLVRGDGEYAVKARDGANVRTITDWTAHPAIPKQDASGKALYGVKVEVDAGTAKVSVNGAPVTTITAKQGPLDGIAGVRVNHNLHVTVTPVSLIR